MWNEKCHRWTEDKSAAFEIPKQKPWGIISFWAMLNDTRNLYTLDWVKNKDFEIKSICGILHIHQNNKMKLSLSTLSVTTSQLQFSDIVCYWKGRPEKGSIIFSTNTESQVPTPIYWKQSKGWLKWYSKSISSKAWHLTMWKKNCHKWLQYLETVPNLEECKVVNRNGLLE